MYTNFGVCDLSGFGDIGTFKNGQISLSDHGLYFPPGGAWRCLSSACLGRPVYQGGSSQSFPVGLTDILYFEKDQI